MLAAVALAVVVALPAALVVAVAAAFVAVGLAMLVAAVGELVVPALVEVVGVGVALPPQATVSASRALTRSNQIPHCFMWTLLTSCTTHHKQDKIGENYNVHRIAYNLQNPQDHIYVFNVIFLGWRQSGCGFSPGSCTWTCLSSLPLRNHAEAVCDDAQAPDWLVPLDSGS